MLRRLAVRLDQEHEPTLSKERSIEPVVDYVDITVFGRQAEVCAEYLATGRRIGVEGRLSHSEWKAEDGTGRQKLEVVARHVEFLDGSQRQDNDDDDPDAGAALAAAAANA